jgi:hypothetical protein
MTIKQITWAVADRGDWECERLGTWDYGETWTSHRLRSKNVDAYEWLKEAVVGDVDLTYVYRVEFWDEHYDAQDYEHVFHKATIYRYAKNAQGQRYLDQKVDCKPSAAKREPIEVILKELPPEELR